MKRIFFSSLCCLICLMVYGQDRFVGLSVGGSLYTGDVDPIARRDFIKNVNVSYGLFYRQEISNRFSFSLKLSRINISASDDINDDFSDGVFDLTVSRLERNFNIKNRITEFSLLAEYKLFSLFGIDFHATVGPAIYRHNPLGLDFEDKVYRPLQPLATEGQGFDDRYSLFQFAIPFGGYMQFAITDKISIQIDLIGRFTFTDYLDDIHEATYLSADLINDPIRQRLADPFLSLGGLSREDAAPSFNPDNTTVIRGNPDVRDYFGSSSISFLYRMPNLKKVPLGCPEF